MVDMGSARILENYRFGIEGSGILFISEGGRAKGEQGDPEQSGFPLNPLPGVTACLLQELGTTGREAVTFMVK